MDDADTGESEAATLGITWESDVDGIAGYSEAGQPVYEPVDPDLETEVQYLLAEIDRIGCGNWNTHIEADISAIRAILDGSENPNQLQELFDNIRYWFETDACKPPKPPEQQFREQFCIRVPCRGCKRIYKRCMRGY